LTSGTDSPGGVWGEEEIPNSEAKAGQGWEEEHILSGHHDVVTAVALSPDVFCPPGGHGLGDNAETSLSNSVISNQPPLKRGYSQHVLTGIGSVPSIFIENVTSLPGCPWKTCHRRPFVGLSQPRSASFMEPFYGKLWSKIDKSDQNQLLK
jgi:hypothetical protein